MSPVIQALLSLMTLTDDKLSLLIKKGTKIPANLIRVKHSELAEALSQLGISVPPHKNTVNLIRDAAIKGTHTGDDFEVCRGEPPQGVQAGRWEWIETMRRPTDHAVENEPIVQVIPPSPPRPGINLFGHEIPAKEEAMPEPVTLNLPPELELRSDGTVIAKASGQVKADGQTMTFSPVYVIEKAHSSEYAVSEFFCDVHVLGDLIGTMKWRVFGNLEVEGHWQASDIEVFGDVQAKGGIQTNQVGPLRFWRNCQTTYIQVSQVGVLGHLTVENSVQLSELRVGGDLTCTSNPGAILGSTLHVYGGVRANKVGSENGLRTRIFLLGDENARKSRFERLLQGTVITYRGESYTAARDTSFDSSQPLTTIVTAETTSSAENSEKPKDAE
jgi:hypothetical protein